MAQESADARPNVPIAPPVIPAGQEYYWTKEWQAGERETLAELAAGRGRTFDTAEDALRYLFSANDDQPALPAVTTESRFMRRLRRKAPPMQAAIAQTIKRLADDPHHPGLQAHRVGGADGVREAYIDRSNRLTFHYGEDGGIVLRNHCNHDILRRSP